MLRVLFTFIKAILKVDMLWGIVLVCGLAGDRIETTIAKRMNIFMAPILTMLL